MSRCTHGRRGAIQACPGTMAGCPAGGVKISCLRSPRPTTSWRRGCRGAVGRRVTVGTPGVRTRHSDHLCNLALSSRERRPSAEARPFLSRQPTRLGLLLDPNQLSMSLILLRIRLWGQTITSWHRGAPRALSLQPSNFHLNRQVLPAVGRSGERRFSGH